MILKGAFERNQIAIFRGVADFYYWKGLPVCREWPRKSTRPQTPAQILAQERFKAAFKWIESNPVSWHTAWPAVNLPTNNSIRDTMRHTALNLAHSDRLYEPPDITNVTAFSNQPNTVYAARIDIVTYPGFDPAKVRFRYRVYNPDPPAFPWAERSLKCTKRRMPARQYVPDLVPFPFPTLQGYSPAGLYVIQFPPTPGTDVQVLPTPINPPEKPVILGPPRNSSP